MVILLPAAAGGLDISSEATVGVAEDARPSITTAGSTTTRTVSAASTVGMAVVIPTQDPTETGTVMAATASPGEGPAGTGPESSTTQMGGEYVRRHGRARARQCVQVVEGGAAKSMILLAAPKWRSAVVCLYPRARTAIDPLCKTMPHGKLRSICGAPPRWPLASDRCAGAATWTTVVTAIADARTTQVAAGN